MDQLPRHRARRGHQRPDCMVTTVLKDDSAALNMQHMGVVKDFPIPY
ncbi:MAG TPA: hypothetical protein VGK67_17650 [Myxococcales bacterium]